MPGYCQYFIIEYRGRNIHDVLIKVAYVATNFMVRLETEWYDRLARRVKTAKKCDALFEDTHDEAQGKPLPSLVHFGTKVATILRTH